MKMIVSTKLIKLHEWIYNITGSICYDREYVYLTFCKSFCNLTKSIFENGASMENGCITIYGIKSDFNAIISYTLSKRLNYLSLNQIDFKCEIINKYSNMVKETRTACFELSQGEIINIDKEGEDYECKI